MFGFQVMNMRFARMQELQERKTADNAGTVTSTFGFGSTSSTSTSSGSSMGSGPSSGTLRELFDNTQMSCLKIPLE
jgi:hypothetical protein